MRKSLLKLLAGTLSCCEPAMADSYLKSRLKRKKCTAEASGGAAKRSPTTPSNNPAKTDAPVLPAAAWWDAQRLLAVERLWAFALTAALPGLEGRSWDQVPDLPRASAASSGGLWIEEHGWCDLSSEVSAFPGPSHLSQSTSQIPDPAGLSSSPEDPRAHTSAVPEPPVRGLSPHSTESSTRSPQPPGKTQRPSLHSWEEAVSSPGPSSVGEGEGRKVSGPVSRQLLTQWVKVSDRAPVQNELASKKEDEVQGCGKKDGAGGGLQSCPMCLQVFPAGSTQMDCDGHLAQCLSDMNMDMTW